jgi:hypothetical protein
MRNALRIGAIAALGLATTVTLGVSSASAATAAPAAHGAPAAVSPAGSYGPDTVDYYGPYWNLESCVIAENHYQHRIEVPCYLAIDTFYYFGGDPGII